MFAIVVEDSPAVLSVLLRFLEKQGIKAVGCSNCEQAIAAIEQVKPDLLVSDWDIGSGPSGVTVVRHLRTRCSDARVVMITGRSVKRLKARTSALEVDAYLEKPFSLVELKHAISPINQ